MENNNVEQNKNKNLIIVVMACIIILLIAALVYFLFIKKGDSEKEPQKQEEKTNINYDILNYQCKKEYCDGEDYINVRELLKSDDPVKSLYSGNDHKIHAVLLENVSVGNRYLYMVDENKYYFKNDNYYSIDIINIGYEGSIVENNNYDFGYAMVHQKITNLSYETANSKIYSFKDKKYVFEVDEYYECAYDEYENQRFYSLRHNGDVTLYDNKFNKVFDKDTYGDFAFDDKYIFGIIKEDFKYKFFKYDITTKKYKLSNVLFGDSDDWDFDCTYNYIVKYNGVEFEIYDFDGNIVFKTDEKTNLKNIKSKDYVMPEFPQLYYSKKENKIKLIIDPEICGDESCPPHFGYSYYEYDISSKKITYKFFTDNIPDSIYKNLFDGYVEI